MLPLGAYHWGRIKERNQASSSVNFKSFNTHNTHRAKTEGQMSRGRRTQEDIDIRRIFSQVVPERFYNPQSVGNGSQRLLWVNLSPLSARNPFRGRYAQKAAVSSPERCSAASAGSLSFLPAMGEPAGPNPSGQSAPEGRQGPPWEDMEPIDDAGARLELQIANLRHAADAIGRISKVGRKCMRRCRGLDSYGL
jgi:hypothetical protein